jgi:glycosyltransferase involved in cell wall biosynthesis
MRRPRGVELAGYLDAAVGSGEAARRYLTALRAAGVPVRARDVPLPGRDPAVSNVSTQTRRSARRVAFNLLFLNPEALLPYLASAAAPRLRNRVTIGGWNWEVDVVPDAWEEAGRRVEEVWACSEFTARLIRAGTSARVVAMLPPLAPAAAVSHVPPELPPGFRVLVMFDYLSTIERKNPIGTIEAYRQAFAPGDGARLIVKSVNGVHRLEQRRQVERAAAGRPDIVLQDGTISGADRDALVTACDCVVSLHRSEGFGLSLAEAMSAGKPVIATGYGGNTEFMTAANSYLVGYEPALVGPGCEHYAANASWAEPDLVQAATALRAVADHPKEAGERAAQGQSEVNTLLAPKRIGGQMRDRLLMLSGETAAEESASGYAGDPQTAAQRR